MSKRTAFPPVFWLANFIEVLERFAYYGIYLGFGIYMEYLGYSKGQLGFVQTLFLLVSYTVPLISGTFADRFGFKKMLLVSYLAYIPTICLLMFTKSFSGIALTMLGIGFAAGIFKPLISGTVRVSTDGSNKTLGFGIFYAMVNVGASFGPVVAGKLRAISWNYAFLVSAITITIMFFVTLFFYKEPEREIEGVTLKQKFADIWEALSDVKFALFLGMLGFFFWIPFWGFFNLVAIFIDKNVDTAALFQYVQMVLGSGIANFLSHVDADGQRKLLGETIAHTGYIIIFFQLFVSKAAERFAGIPTFLFGLFVTAVGFVVLAFAAFSSPAFAFLGIFIFAVGEMIASPRIQEYITWMAPKEKAGLYMGASFLSVGVGAFSGMIYTPLYGMFREMGHPEYVWYVLAAHTIIGIGAIWGFVKFMGDFKELDN
ncbi:MAG: MFS transporter [Pseudomonadota bacterium]